MIYIIQHFIVLIAYLFASIYAVGLLMGLNRFAPRFVFLTGIVAWAINFMIFKAMLHSSVGFLQDFLALAVSIIVAGLFFYAVTVIRGYMIMKHRDL